MKLIDRTALRLHPAAKGFVNVNACLLASKMPSDAYGFLTLATTSVQSPTIHRTHVVATTINAELAEPAEKTGSVLRVLRFLR
jgi:hypothetical protein